MALPPVAAAPVPSPPAGPRPRANVAFHGDVSESREATPMAWASGRGRRSTFFSTPPSRHAVAGVPSRPGSGGRRRQKPTEAELEAFAQQDVGEPPDRQRLTEQHHRELQGNRDKVREVARFIGRLPLAQQVVYARRAMGRRRKAEVARHADRGVFGEEVTRCRARVSNVVAEAELFGLLNRPAESLAKIRIHSAAVDDMLYGEAEKRADQRVAQYEARVAHARCNRLDALAFALDRQRRALVPEPPRRLVTPPPHLQAPSTARPGWSRPGRGSLRGPSGAGASTARSDRSERRGDRTMDRAMPRLGPRHPSLSRTPGDPVPASAEDRRYTPLQP